MKVSTLGLSRSDHQVRSIDLCTKTFKHSSPLKYLGDRSSTHMLDTVGDTVGEQPALQSGIGTLGYLSVKFAQTQASVLGSLQT